MSEGRFKVTKKDQELNNEAWKRFVGGNPAYMFVPLKKAKFKRNPEREANA